MARIFDVIEFFDETGRRMVHRLPEHGSGDFRLGSQLIVRESQAAVFFRDGKALDTFGPGRHTLSTANIPLLTGLISIPFSGETPFKAEVYFVNLREFLEQKWGTPEAITLRDSELGMVRLRAFGTYSMQVNDPQLFVNKIVGTQGLYETSQIQGFLRGIIIAKLTDLLGEVRKSILDLPSLYDEIGAGAKAKVQDDFNALGIALKTLYVTSISPTEDTAKAIDERAAMGAIGNMQAYLQFKAARAMTEAAAAPGGVAGAGVGLGAGVGMGAAMAQMMAQAMQPGAQVATMMCPSCSAQIPAGSKFCPQCGAKIGGAMICPNCKADVPEGSKFCPNCGTKIA
ncbi:MAG: SPFH domain-containing protein [Chloroflexi bacterium]|nr:SPFH domain-containing protein [Chloroflexota bacterium]